MRRRQIFEDVIDTLDLVLSPSGYQLSDLGIVVLNEKLYIYLYKYYPVSTTTEKMKYNKPVRLELWRYSSIKAMILNKIGIIQFLSILFLHFKP